VKIDAHVHFWRYDASEYPWIDDAMAVLRRDFLPEDGKREMDRAGIDACVAVQARQTLEETRWLLGLADTYSFIAGVVGWVDLQSDDAVCQLEQVGRHPRLVGVRHIVQDETDDRFLLRPAFCRGISLLDDLDLAYDILIYPKHLKVAADFVSRFPRNRFVIDHLAKPSVRSGEMREWERDLRRLAAFPHVFCKISGLVTEALWDQWKPADLRPYLDVAFDCFGTHRLIAGSDWPVCTVAADYGRTLSVLTAYLARYSAAEREGVMGRNAQRFWNLPHTVDSPKGLCHR
jgi:L-fuconolactonase